MVCTLWSVGPSGPFWPKSNDAKRGQGGQPPTSKARWAHVSQIWPPSHQSHKWPKGPQDLNSPFSTLFLWQSPEATSSSSGRFPPQSGQRLLLTNVLHTMDSGMVHIWYTIPLCTDFAQQSNGDGFRTKLGHFKQSPQIPHPFRRKSFQGLSPAIQGGYQKTI
ncbi:hypothetical protein O181_093857 [Austropuccinia psidii MF-1]|uniref:Uncharacterized protein n=1 Tax=Austropuccinia psidii MF-1 TaxID=1389203 RepID=A0A9Q3J1U0_9BASI|nr:hypothetical protein [Austropuccinia psidii MF-1]